MGCSTRPRRRASSSPSAVARRARGCSLVTSGLRSGSRGAARRCSSPRKGRCTGSSYAARASSPGGRSSPGLPFGRHQQDTVAVGPDGRLYLGSGATCNACVEKDRRSAAILSAKQDGSDLRVVARGLRNPFGLAFEPGSDRLYASDNARDDLGETEPAETIVRVRPGRRLWLARLLVELARARAARDAAAGSRSRSRCSSRTPPRTASPSGAAACSSPSGAST